MPEIRWPKDVIFDLQTVENATWAMRIQCFVMEFEDMPKKIYGQQIKYVLLIQQISMAFSMALVAKSVYITTTYTFACALHIHFASFANYDFLWKKSTKSDDYDRKF